MTPAELWAKDAEQIDLMLAALEIEREAGPHGIPMDVATSPRAAPSYYGADALRFRARPVMDWAQHAISVARDELLKGDENADISAYRFVIDETDYSTQQ